VIRPEIQSLATPITQLKPHPQNVRQGDIGAISLSLEQHGQYRPIVVQQSTGFILAGNHTYKAAKALKWKDIAATFVDVDDEQALRILLVDNRANDLAMYDDAALAEVLKYLDSTTTGLAGTLFDGDDLDDLIFKLEGSLGFVADGLSAVDLKDSYDNAEIRNLSLPYDRDQIETIKQRLGELMKKNGATSFSDVVWDLVAKAL
jgi:hypothetical protein